MQKSEIQPSLVITCEGGVIQEIHGDVPFPVDVIVVDYDIDGADSDALKTVTYPSGDSARALISRWRDFEPYLPTLPDLG